MSVTPVCDLRSAFGTARNQNNRPTCCAFACSDLHAACRMPWEALSCEYAFYHGVRRQGTGPTSGVYLRHMLDAVEQDGQPLESGWPYLSVIPADVSLWVPPSNVGQLFRARGAPSAGNVVAVREAIDQDCPVLIVMTLSDAFYGPDAHGVVGSAESVDPSRVHALLAVGYGTRDSDAFTLVRNSWGESWGLSGHAWLSESYLAPRILEIATMTKAM